MYNYWCENIDCRKECSLCDSKGDIQLESKEINVCAMSKDVELKLMGETISLGIGEPLRHRPKKEARERATKDFKKNIYPTLSQMDKLHHKRKWKKTGQ